MYILGSQLVPVLVVRTDRYSTVLGQNSLAALYTTSEDFFKAYRWRICNLLFRLRPGITAKCRGLPRVADQCTLYIYSPIYL